MSKREKAEIMRRKKEAEKARKLGLDPESIALRGQARFYQSEEDQASAL